VQQKMAGGGGGGGSGGGSSGGALMTAVPHYTSNPVQVYTLPGSIAQVCCGPQSTMFLDAQQRVWVCGRNDKGQLSGGGGGRTVPPMMLTDFGNGVASPRVEEMAAGASSCVLLDGEGGVWQLGGKNGEGGNGGNGGALAKVTLLDQAVRVGISGSTMYAIVLDKNKEDVPNKSGPPRTLRYARLNRYCGVVDASMRRCRHAHPMLFSLLFSEPERPPCTRDPCQTP